jgi:hypothetical protein
MSDLVKNLAASLDLTQRFNVLNEEVDETPAHELNGASWMPHILANFMFHLASPSDEHGKLKKALHESEQLDELGPDLPHPAMALPKTSHVISVGREQMPAGNIHKRIGEGFKKAYSEMATEKPSETRAKHSEAKKVFANFTKERGYKGELAPKMLKGNHKTRLSSGAGVSTTGLNLAPHATAGLHNFDVCPNASKECRSSCLGLTAGGNKQYPDNALSSKVLRTHFLAHHPEHAARLIDKEITNHKKKAAKEGMKAGIRMNITSDLAWEHHAPQMFEKHKDVQFYDYTKMHNRVMRSLAPKKDPQDFHNSMGHPSNYHLTLSHTGTGHDESNDHHVIKVLEHGGTVASVFKRNKEGHLPTHIEDVQTGKRYPVKNGDNDDNTFDRPKAVSGLKLKGIKNEAAGRFANHVDDDRIARINHNPPSAEKAQPNVPKFTVAKPKKLKLKE